MSYSTRRHTHINTAIIAGFCGVTAFFSFSLSANAMTINEKLSFMEGQLSGMAAILTAFYPGIAGEVLGASTADIPALEVLLAKREANLVTQESRLAKLKALTAPTATQLETITTVEGAIVRIKASIEKTKGDIEVAKAPAVAPATPAPTESGATATQLRLFKNAYLNLSKYSHSITQPSATTVTLSWSDTLSADSLKVRIVETTGYGRRATTTVFVESSVAPTAKQFVWSGARAGNFTVEFIATKYGVEKTIKQPISVVDTSAPSTIELNKFKYGRFMMGKTIFELKQPASTTVNLTWTDTLNADSVSLRIEETIKVGNIATTTVLANEAIDPSVRKFTWTNPKVGFFQVILTGKRYGTQMETVSYITVRDVTAYLAPNNFAVRVTHGLEPQITWIDTLGADNVTLTIERLTNPTASVARHVYEPVVTLNPVPATKSYILKNAVAGEYRATLRGSRFGKVYNAGALVIVTKPPVVVNAKDSKNVGGQQVTNNFSILGIESKDVVKGTFGTKVDSTDRGTTHTVRWSNVSKVSPVIFTANVTTKSEVTGKNIEPKTVTNSRIVATATSTGEKLITTFSLPAGTKLSSLVMSGVLNGKMITNTHYITADAEMGSGKSETNKGDGDGQSSSKTESSTGNKDSANTGTGGGLQGGFGNGFAGVGNF